MSEKTSQRTEEEMLDRTFGGYDEEVTVQTESPQTEDAGKTTITKKKSNNMILFGGIGAACVVAIGYLLIKPGTPAPVQQSGSSSVNVNKSASANTQSVTPVTNTAPANTPNPTDLANNLNPANPVQASAPQDAAAAQYLAGQNGTPVQNPLVGNRADNGVAGTGVQPVVNVAASTVNVTTPDTTVASSTPISVATPGAVGTTVATTGVPGTVGTVGGVGSVGTVNGVTPDQPNQPVALTAPNLANGNNNVQQAMVTELRALFDQQTKQIQSSIDQVGGRVTNLEKAVNDQKAVNQSIEERLARLEAGKSTKTSVSKTEVAPVTTSDNTTDVKEVAKPKKVYHKHVVRKSTYVARAKHSDDSDNGDILVDKKVGMSSVTDNSSSNYAPVEIHSVFAGRVWTKNKDGSLSTYSTGDRLPSGEVIRRIDDAKAEIVTDKRVIK